MERIDSVNNPKIKAWSKLNRKKERDRTGLFCVEGEHLVQEALRAGIVERILSVDDTFSSDEVPFTEVSAAVLAKLSANVSAPSVMAVCRMEPLHPVEKNRLLILDGVQDPGNLGTLIRTAMSFQYDAVYCSPETCDFYNEKVIRSTQGALFHIPLIRTDLSKLCGDLQKEGVTVIATTLQEAVSLRKLIHPERHALILGNEGSGVSPQLQEAADQRVRIEMKGFESLNVAVAGGIMMYELTVSSN